MMLPLFLPPIGVGGSSRARGSQVGTCHLYTQIFPNENVAMWQNVTYYCICIATKPGYLSVCTILVCNTVCKKRQGFTPQTGV